MDDTLTLEKLQETARLFNTQFLTPLYGLSIVYNSLCLKETTVPVRQLKVRRWMRVNYVLRIQKKWNKRFGFRKEPRILRAPNGFIAHPSFKPSIEEAAVRNIDRAGNPSWLDNRL